MVARAGWTADDFISFRRSRPAQNLFLRRFAAAGGRIAAGTDAANQMLIPGYSLHREMELLVAAGISPRDAILADIDSYTTIVVRLDPIALAGLRASLRPPSPASAEAPMPATPSSSKPPTRGRWPTRCSTRSKRNLSRQTA